MDSRKAQTKLCPRNAIGVCLSGFHAGLYQPLKQVVGLLILEIMLSGFHPSRDHRLQKVQRLLDPRIQALHRRQVRGALIPEPRQAANILNGGHDFDGVVDGGVEVLLAVAKFGTNKDSAGYHGHDSKEFHVNVDFRPVVADIELQLEGLSDLVGDGGIETN